MYIDLVLLGESYEGHFEGLSSFISVGENNCLCKSTSTEKKQNSESINHQECCLLKVRSLVESEDEHRDHPVPVSQTCPK